MTLDDLKKMAEMQNAENQEGTDQQGAEELAADQEPTSEQVEIKGAIIFLNKIGDLFQEKGFTEEAVSVRTAASNVAVKLQAQENA